MEAVDHVFGHFCDMWTGALGEACLRLVLYPRPCTSPDVSTLVSSDCNVLIHFPILYWPGTDYPQPVTAEAYGILSLGR
jgi:hypothetical protein